jgi:hypothetical protein
MINSSTPYVRYKNTGQTVRLSREGYQGWYVYIDSKEVFVPSYQLEEL